MPDWTKNNLPQDFSMRILIIGATGTIGKAIVTSLQGKHEVLQASRQGSHFSVDLTDPASIQALIEQVGVLNAIVSAAGETRLKPLAGLTDQDFEFCIGSKLMGQVNLIRYGLQALTDNGCITVTSGVLSQKPIPGGSAVSLTNAGLEGFVRAAALEAPRGIRINVVSPPWVNETLLSLGMPLGNGLPAATVAQAYVHSLEGTMTGEVLYP
ncbi:aklaviketone reductase [Synechocystis sp. PCC 6803]|uniref:Aklaviketone reductase n=2 Tax=Synechocystis TaxID=1142 RepID=P73288_SYNY3|nr:aklaviketone reductase [Synechocystis sp. PCC 6803]AVP91223.1 short chain dehydrogenase [Synechocystis sp. IPPAS B-1465]MBD2617411.1 short chain dehydrogenase [Synechocystis sp. FACHB-898]MBD2639843.1 short chain dehydrogenase [Synechocystis sp. FACHB-908]MBD2659866.1 short chain dehydrogenase [Synechocystis sp. FACHB-929]BAL28489.1 aklaviketone reductase [Synechocystis sp. PCC 6803 substr. GT-I]BAL31658.1 aklaviketone reductase [Synechocystis sp. PCC 6803 substr. PCC-N]BAL34827.1 aklavik